MFNAYQQAADWLQTELPFFQKSGAAAYHPGLETTKAMLRSLGDPHQRLRFIHIGGTNGKGSSAHMLASILMKAGYRTGLYTSPHLKRITERCRIDGREMEEEDFVGFVNRMVPDLDRFKPTFFEFTTVMALDHFARKAVDVVVLEVGLGGRLDATNVIQPEVVLITNIGHDHLDIIGPDIADVAREKAGIIKPGIPVVIGEKDPRTGDIFRNRAEQAGAPIHWASDEFRIRETDGAWRLTSTSVDLRIDPDLKGLYQKKNICGVAMVVEILRRKGFDISAHHLIDGIGDTARTTGLRGRWQVIADRPMIVCDTAHNPEGLQQVATQAVETGKKLHWVLGMVADKDVAAALMTLPTSAEYYFCRASSPRSMDSRMLAQEAAKAGLTGETFETLTEALGAAKRNAGPDDLILISGSTYLVAEVDGI